MEAGGEHFYIWGSEGLAIVCDDKIVIKSYDRTETVMPHKGSDGHALMWKHFEECIIQNMPPKFRAFDALKGLRIAEAMGRSLRTGTCQDCEVSDPI
jgi:hypothetical protein